MTNVRDTIVPWRTGLSVLSLHIAGDEGLLLDYTFDGPAFRMIAGTSQFIENDTTPIVNEVLRANDP